MSKNVTKRRSGTVGLVLLLSVLLGGCGGGSLTVNYLLNFVGLQFRGVTPARVSDTRSLPSVPSGSGAYANGAIADKALEYASGGSRANYYGNTWGGNACHDAGKLNSDGVTVGKDGGGQCRTFVNCIVSLVSGGKRYPDGTWFDAFGREGGVEINSADKLMKGDIVQSGDGVHTFIIVSHNSGKSFHVVDSNHDYHEHVMDYDRDVELGGDVRAFRMGQAASAPMSAMTDAEAISTGDASSATADTTPATDSAAPTAEPSSALDAITTADAGGRPDDVVGSPFGPGEERHLQLRGVGGVPASGAGSVVLNVTATGATASTYVTVWPSGAPRPNASTLNVIPGRNVANSTVMALPADGGISVFNEAGSVQVIVDVMGWFAADSGFVGVTPARLADTRQGTSTADGVLAGAGAIGPKGTLAVPVLGRGGVPNSAVKGVFLNVTATNPTNESYLTVWGTGDAQPNASNLNTVPGQTVPNLVLARPGADGSVSVFNDAGSTDVVVDVVGYVPDSSQITPTFPARVLDTRTDPNPVILNYPVQITGKAGVPEGAGAVVLNVTAMHSSKASWLDSGHTWPSDAYVTVYPDGQAQPGTSNLNVTKGFVTPNLVVVALSGSGAIRLATDGKVDLLIDVMGWMPSVGDAPTQLAAGSGFLCARLASGKAGCLGDNTSGQTGSAPGGRVDNLQPVAGMDSVTSIAAGPSSACASLVNGTVSCWGVRFDASAAGGPVAVGGIANATQVAVGLAHGCALLADTTVKCWGANFYGQLGNGSLVNSTTAVTVGGLSNVVALSAAGNTTCARLADATLWCWGDNRYGQLRVPIVDTSSMWSSTPVQVIGAGHQVTDVVVEADEICAVVDGAIECGGLNHYGSLGDTTTPSGAVHRFSPGGGVATRIFAGAGQACAFTASGQVWCWGPLHDSSTYATDAPSQLQNVASPIAMAMAADYACALVADGRIGCVGSGLATTTSAVTSTTRLRVDGGVMTVEQDTGG